MRLSELLSIGDSTEEVKSAKPLENIWASDVEDTYFPQYEPENLMVSRSIRAIGGVEEGIKTLGDLPEEMEIFGRRVGVGFGPYFGDTPEDTERKTLNLITAERNLQTQRKERYLEGEFTPEEMDTFPFKAGAGGVSLGTMLLPVFTTMKVGKALGAGTKAITKAQKVSGIGTMGVLELGGDTSARTPLTPTGEIDVDKITPEWARIMTLTTVASASTKAAIESATGVGRQVDLWWAKPMKLSGRAGTIAKRVSNRIYHKGKLILGTATSEGVTEVLQEEAGLGWLLADGSINMGAFVKNQKSVLDAGLVGMFWGTATGSTVAINQRAKVLKELHEIVGPVIGNPEETREVVEAIYNEGNAQMTTVISKELEISSQLKAKHGSIYDNMNKSIKSAIEDSGAFTGVEESELAQYVSDTAKLFADQSLAEANKRGILLDGIIQGADIKFENGKIQLANGENIIAETTEIEVQGELFQLAGEQAVFGDKDALSDAKKLRKQKVSPQEIFKKTGWLYDSKNKKWRFEISDDKASFKSDIIATGEAGTFKIGDIIEHEALFLNYPQIKDQKIKFVKYPKRKDGGELRGRYSVKNGMEVNIELDEKTSLSTIIHELQHAVQRIEKISPNFNIKYKGRPTEVEARFTQKRIELSGQERFIDTFKQGKKGSFNVSEKAIELTKLADFSTLPHEFAHFWLDNIFDYVRTGNASDAYIKNLKPIKDWLKITDNQPFLTRAQQEKFAKGYEKYITTGNLPNRLLGDTFDDYDKWLKRVYDSANIKGTMKPEVVEFFRTMTTGELKAPEDYVQSKTLEKEIQVEKEQVQEDTQEVITAKEKQFNNKPVEKTTEFGKKDSSVFKKHADIAGIEQTLQYDVTNIEEQNKLAEAYLQSNFDDVVKIVNGEKEAPSGILKNAIYNAYLKQMLETGNNEAYLTALRNQSLELTRAGQEISSQRGVIDNIFAPAYWISSVEQGRKISLAPKYDETVNDSIDNFMADIMSKETPEAQQAEVDKIIKSLGKELGKKPEELNQSIRDKLTNEKSAYNVIKAQIDEAMGISLSTAEASSLIAQAENLKKNALNSVDENGNLSVEFFSILADTENMANKLNPTNRVTVLTSIAGRGAMLASIKSPILNIESNFLNSITERITKRAVMKLTSDVKISNEVDKKTMKDYMEYSKNIYKTSGYTISSMSELDPEIKIKGEVFEHSQGKGIIRKFGRMYEQTVFKYLLGYNDRYMKDITFVDTAGLEATKQARIEKSKNIKSRATEIFNDAIKIEPETKIGQKIRDGAISDALVATYMNDSKLGKIALDLRELVNKGTGPLKVGTLVAIFVKTPANVISLGVEYTFGGTVAVKNMNTIINDFQTGKISETTQKSIRSLSRNTLGVVASIIFAAGFIDDEDYIPDYNLLSPRQRTLVKQKNGVFNSIRIGNRYVSLDYFGPLAMPLVSVLEFKRQKEIKESIFGFGKGAANQLLNMPSIGDFADLYKDLSRKITQEGQKTLEGLGEFGVDFISSRSIPAIVSDIAKQIDGFERDTNRSATNRAISRIPFARETLPKQFNRITGDPIRTESLSILFGSRLKTGKFTFEVSEIERLIKDGNSVSITDPTRFGALKTLNDIDIAQARQDFAAMYSEEISKEMDKASWDRKEDEDKTKALNKIRSKITKKLKKEYGVD